MRLSRRRLAPSLVGLLAVAALLLGCGGTGPGERPPLRVLLVGNSLTASKGPGGFHPSTTGTYLAALTVYAGLTKTSPVGLPRTVEAGSVEVSLTARVARTLQLSAAEALARG